MVGGALRCLGSSQRLRSRYGHGFQIELGMALPPPESISSQAAAIVTASGKAIPANSSAEDLTLTRTELMNVFTALSADHWKERVHPDKSGAELHLAMESNGNISVKYLSCKYFLNWLCPNLFS